MSKETAVGTLGLLVAVTPFLGFPSIYRTIALALFGLTIALIGFSMRRASLAHPQGHADAYHTDTIPFNEDPNA